MVLYIRVFGQCGTNVIIMIDDIRFCWNVVMCPNLLACDTFGGFLSDF